jgi:CRP/FNR family cyclic AMP-dependent transcriptional regulator
MNSSMGKNEIYSSSEFEENLSILREINFFSKLPLEMLKVLAYLCTRENYKAGDYLFRQNDDDGQAFYIISGVASLLRGDGGQGVVIQEFAANAFLGGLSLLGNSQRLFSLQARTDMTCLILTRQKFDKTMEKFPDIVPRVLQALVDSISSWEKIFLTKIGEGCDTCRQKVGVSLL